MWPSQRPLQCLQKARVIGSKNQCWCRDCHQPHPHACAQFSFLFPVEVLTVRLLRRRQCWCRDCHYPHPHAQFSFPLPVEVTTVRPPRWLPPWKSKDFRGQTQRERSSVSICCGGCAFQRGSRLKLPLPQTDTTSVHCLSSEAPSKLGPTPHRLDVHPGTFIIVKMVGNKFGRVIGASDALLNRNAVMRVCLSQPLRYTSHTG
jgi:hypothetical protein